MKHLKVVAFPSFLAVSALALSACGSGQPAETTQSSPAATASPSSVAGSPSAASAPGSTGSSPASTGSDVSGASSTPSISPLAGLFGANLDLLETGVGQSFTATDLEGNTVAEISIDGLDTNPQCTGDYPREAENGQFIKLDLSVTTGSEEAVGLDFGVYSWKYISEDGQEQDGWALSGPSYLCLDSEEEISHTIEPNSSDSGALILDVPSGGGGTLTFMHYQEDMASAQGWYINLPES